MPNSAEALLIAERRTRDEARARLDEHVDRIRGDIEERGIGGRIADEASAKALAALDEAAEIANDSKGVIGGTIALLALWFFRRPLLDAFEAMLGGPKNETEGYEDDGNW